jgi:ABC-type cobalt transport system substrate-binding protein
LLFRHDPSFVCRSEVDARTEKTKTERDLAPSGLAKRAAAKDSERGDQPSQEAQSAMSLKAKALEPAVKGVFERASGDRASRMQALMAALAAGAAVYKLLRSKAKAGNEQARSGETGKTEST